MKANEEIKKLLVISLRNNLEDFYKTAKGWLTVIENAKTVEEIIDCKRKLLETYVNFMPLADEHCYFCIKEKFNNSDYRTCEESCQYAKHHGVCSFMDSDYKKITEMRGLLLIAIKNYYRDETYEEESEQSGGEEACANDASREN